MSHLLVYLFLLNIGGHSLKEWGQLWEGETCKLEWFDGGINPTIFNMEYN